MVAKPVGIASLIERVVGETEHGGNNLRLCGDNRVAVQVQEHVPGQESRTLIAVRKAVVLAKACRVGGCQVVEVGLAIGEQVLGSGQGRFYRALVSYPRQAAKFGQLVAVNL